MKAAMIGDNCIDIYRFIDGKEINRCYPTGNVVDTGVNLKKLGVSTAIISTTGNDEYGRWMIETLKKEELDLSHFKIGNGATAITYMDMNGTDRVHGEYIEGVLENIVFDEEDISFAALHDLVHTALWGKADGALDKIRKKNPSILISFDYCDRLDNPIVEKTLPWVDIGFFSCHIEDTSYIKEYLRDKVSRGMKLAVMTLGEKGSLAWDGKSWTAGPVYPVRRVVNTVGAGDSYIAGFLCGILKGLSIDACMRSGARVAAQVVEVFEPWVTG